MSRLNRRKAMVFAALLLIICQLLIVFSFDSGVAAEASKTLVVPDDYPSITAAVGNASAGDTILVKSGTYNENVYIDKSLLVEGVDSANTIVVGQGGAVNTFVFNITAENVLVSGFTIESANYSASNLYASGVAVAANNCTVTDNKILNVYRGIYCGGWGNYSGSISQTTITDNNISGALSNGIMVYGGSGNVISNNNLVACKSTAIIIDGYSNVVSNNNLNGNSRGIGIRSTYSAIFGNKITYCANWGMYFESPNSVIEANYIANNRWGIFLSPAFPPQNNTFYHNDFVNNTKQVNLGLTTTVEKWDNGSASGGNYWSNNTSVDAAFVIGVNNTDNYPLASPFNVASATAIPNLIQPTPIQDNTVALWHLDTLAADMSSPDATGNNPLMFSPLPYLPNVVPGEFGQALNFTFYPYGMALASPSLDVTGDITIDAWIKVSSYENTTYNNILVMSGDSLNEYVSRIYGFAVNGLSPGNATSGPTGALCGYVWTTSGYNEIVTTNAPVKVGVWTHVVFTRSTSTGMHIYVNGVEQPVMVTSGSQNPTGNIMNGNELYFGADYSGYIDEVRISNTAQAPQAAVSQPLWLQSWFWAAAAGATVAILAGTLFAHSKRQK